MLNPELFTLTCCILKEMRDRIAALQSGSVSMNTVGLFALPLTASNILGGHGAKGQCSAGRELAGDSDGGIVIRARDSQKHEQAVSRSPCLDFAGWPRVG